VWGLKIIVGEGASSKGGVNGLPTLRLPLNFDCNMTHIIKGKIRLKVYLVGNIWGKSFNEPKTFKLSILIQTLI